MHPLCAVAFDAISCHASKHTVTGSSASLRRTAAASNSAATAQASCKFSRSSASSCAAELCICRFSASCAACTREHGRLSKQRDAHTETQRRCAAVCRDSEPTSMLATFWSQLRTSAWWRCCAAEASARAARSCSSSCCSFLSAKRGAGAASLVLARCSSCGGSGADACAAAAWKRKWRVSG